MSEAAQPLSFDDPKPEPEKRRQQNIFLRPSLKTEIDQRRGKTVSRSAWIEQAIIERLRRSKSPPPGV